MGETPKATFKSLSSYFEFFIGFQAVLAGYHDHMPTGMVSLSSGIPGSEIPRLRHLSTEEFLGQGVPSIQWW